MSKDSILLVDDDPGSIQLMGRILADVGDLRFAMNGADALMLARQSVPALTLLDAQMPGMSGFETCQAFKSDPTLAEVPVIFVTSHGEPEFEVSGLELGAVDFIAKPVSGPLLLARVKTQLRVKHMADELRRMATIDVLTGIANRRLFDQTLEGEWRRGQRCTAPLALLMIDVDHFKAFNDCYGHLAGDACLHAVAQALKTVAGRPGDLVARYGGEEFVVLLPETLRDGAGHVANRLLDAVAALRIDHETSSTAPHVTVSVGIGCYDQNSAGRGSLTSWSCPGDHGRERFSAVDLVQAADKALYCAKRGGRDQARLLDIGSLSLPDGADEAVPRGRPSDIRRVAASMSS